jgi:hypothetical protein
VTDFKFEMSGVYGTGRKWSTGVHASSADDIAAAVIEWGLKIADFWTNGTFGAETLYATTTEVTQLSVIQLGPTFHEVQRIDAPVTLAGTAAGEENANQLAILASLRNPFSGARNRGRMYLPAPAEDASNEGVLLDAKATRVATALEALFTGMRSDGYTFFVFNRTAHPDDPIPFTKKTITNEKIDKVLRTQRRRVRKEAAIYVA